MPERDAPPPIPPAGWLTQPARTSHEVKLGLEQLQARAEWLAQDARQVKHRLHELEKQLREAQKI